jgi:hypothetical protein
MTTGWTAPARINPSTLGNMIKAAPRPAAIGPEAWTRCVPEKVRTELSAYSFDQLLLTGQYALAGTGNNYKGFDKLFLLFEPSGIERALWVLDCLERAEGTGPVPEEEFPSFSADMKRLLAPDGHGLLNAIWGNILAHDLRNCLAGPLGQTEIAMARNPESTNMIFFSDVLDTANTTISKALAGSISIGNFIKEEQKDSFFINGAFEKASSLFPERVSADIGSKIKDLSVYLSLYKGYSPEEVMILSPNSDASQETFQKPADLFLLRDDPGSILFSMLDRAATRRGMGGGEANDSNWRKFLGIVSGRPRGAGLIEEALAAMHGSGHPMEQILSSGVSQ